MNVPDDAIVIVPSRGMRDIVGPPRNDAAAYPGSLISSTVDTVGGGHEIAGTYGACTYSFTAMLAGVVRPVTAAHCSYQKWFTDSTRQFINNQYSFYESYDPDPSSCTSFEITFHICYKQRRSDAALYSIYPDSNLKYRVGLISRTNRVSDNTGLNSVNASKPWLYVTGYSTFTDGQTVDKMGKSSGWTYGNVNQTCIDYSGPNYTRLICAGKAHFYSREGDSGAPVFAWDGADGVTLVGIASTVDCDIPCTEDYDTVFTPMSGVFNDLGSLSVAINTTVGTPNISGSVSGSALLSWSAVSTTNTANATTYRIFRTSWDASTYNWAEQNVELTPTTSTSFTDTTSPIAVYSYSGTYAVNLCSNSWVSYTVMAYNSGVTSAAMPVYFVGAADGATPYQIQCP